MAESALLWSSYLMIVAVVILGINGMLRLKSVTKRVDHSTFILTIFTLLIPFAPIILFILLYMLVGFPESVVRLTSLELNLFNIAIESVSAGVSVIAFLWLVMLLNAGLGGALRKVRSRYLGAR